MLVDLICQECGKPYAVTPSVARKGSRYCSSPCRVRAVSRGNTRPLAERYWEKVQKGSDDECWPWIGGCFADGYGAISVNGRPVRAPRLSYEIANGPLRGDEHVRHQCDNPICVNPHHLLKGSPADNAADKVSRGRQSRNIKLTDGQVRAVRDSNKPLAALAAEYNVSVGLISLIRGRTGHRLGYKVTMSKRRERSL